MRSINSHQVNGAAGDNKQARLNSALKTPSFLPLPNYKQTFILLKILFDFVYFCNINIPLFFKK